MIKLIFLAIPFLVCWGLIYHNMMSQKSGWNLLSDQFNTKSDSDPTGLNIEDKKEILLAINKLKERAYSELDDLKNSTDKKLFTLQNWSDELALRAYSYAKKCPSTTHSSLLNGLTVSKTHMGSSQSLSQMVDEWYEEINLLVVHYDAPDSGEYQGIIEEGEMQFKKDIVERVGCAKTRCFIDKVSSTLLVCMWEFN